MQERTIGYEGGNIFYTEEGMGEVLVLIHGYLESSEVWGRFRERLVEKYRVVCIDLPGNGRSSVYTQNHSMCFHAGAVLAVMEKEKIDRFFVLGHSLGGYVTLSLVENHPERLKGYIMLHSHPYADTDEIIDNRLRELKIVKAGKQDAIYPANIKKMFADVNLEKFREDVDALVRIASGHKAEGIIAVIEGMIKRKSREEIMAESEVPLLYVLGEMDNYIPYEKMVKNILVPESTRIFTLETSGHMGFLEETDILVSRVSAFITENQDI